MMIPKFVDLETWANSLIIDFPNENIPILDNTNNWKDWGNEVIQTPTFSQNAAPPTNSYTEWRGWAESVFSAMSNF